MSIPKILSYSAIVLFVAIGVAAFFKSEPKNTPAPVAIQEISSPHSNNHSLPLTETPVVTVVKKVEEPPLPAIIADQRPKNDFPSIDRMFQLFTIGPSKLPIVETIEYTSTVEWLQGRLAWVADYASHFGTSRHFIARSLNGKPDYFSQKVYEGSKFNVFRKDKNIQFYLLVDVSRLKMGFYYVDLGTNERVLLKTYSIGLGRLDPSKPSGTLTPLGRYSLGNKVAIYQPGVVSAVQDKKVEMVRVFGTRWIPFDQEVERVTSSARGYGIYGAPWIEEPKTGRLVENLNVIGKYDTDGGIRMASEDLEELYAIVITKPTFVEIVTDFRDAKLPGIEVATPTK